MGNVETRNNIFKKLLKYLSSKIKKLQLIMNNKKIRSKTVYLYVFCVLVPVVVTNTIIISNALEATRKEENENINNITDSIALNITSSLESAVYVTVDLYTSSSICKFLDTQYANPVKYFQAYNSVFGNYVFYASSKHLISGITLYSDNSKMINGGKYYRIDTVQAEEWYQRFIGTNQDLFIYPYYNKTNYDNNKKRMISVIRKLNYIGVNDIEKIVKLDLNYEKLCEIVNGAAFDTAIYVCHGNDIIFSNDKRDKGIKKDFMKVSMIPMEEVLVHKSVTSYGFDFDIYLKDYKSKYSSMIRSNLWLIAILLLADALIPAIMLALFSSSITSRVLLLGKYLKKVKREEFDPIPQNEGKDEIGELLDDYNLMAARMKNLIEYEYKSKLEQQELYLARQQAELLALYSQINPHFLFNVLETIRMRSVIKGEQETSKMIESLAKLMRKSAEWGADLITIEQEIGFTEYYLNLQKYRFGDNFNYKFRINKDCYDYMIPSLILVTFIENSCVHGFNREGHSGSIFLSIYEENSFLNIEVEDTGIGMEEEQVKRLNKLLNEADIDELQKSTSLGMLNACIRVKKYCKNQVKILVESEPQVGTCIILKIPVGCLNRYENQ